VLRPIVGWDGDTLLFSLDVSVYLYRRLGATLNPNPGDGTAFCCHCFLSISFQFLIEISLFRVPLIQYFVLQQ